MKRIVIACLTLIISLSLFGCDLDQTVTLLSEADEAQVVDFLSKNEDTIRSRYQEWNGSVIEFENEIRANPEIKHGKSVDFAMKLTGTFFVDNIRQVSYVLETMSFMLNSSNMISISTGAYVTEDNIYYDYYKIDGLLLSDSFSYFALNDDSIKTAAWIDFFSPNEFLFGLYDKSFEELSDYGERFFFSKNNGGDYLCKVEHSIDYCLHENLKHWTNIKDIFSEDYLSFFDIDADEICGFLQNADSIEEIKKTVTDFAYCTEYKFSGDALCGADISKRIEFGEERICLTENYNVTPLKKNISIDKTRYTNDRPFLKIGSAIGTIDIDKYLYD